jgi:hypothetical protein
MSIASLLYCSNRNAQLELCALSSLRAREEAQPPYVSISASSRMVFRKQCGVKVKLLKFPRIFYFGKAEY